MSKPNKTRKFTSAMAQTWQKNPESLTTDQVQLWGSTMRGLIAAEKAKKMVESGRCFVISCQAIGFFDI